MKRPFAQVDVFTATAYAGNPVAVVLDSGDLSSQQMQRFANWTNLSETTFVLPPVDREADYLVRIFTPTLELPFAGHPTLGTCHAWLTATGADRDRVVQECGAGLIDIRRTDAGLAFAAPALVRSGPIEDRVMAEVVSVLGVEREAIVDSQWVDNGPGWLAILLGSVDEVLALRPGTTELDIGAVALDESAAPEQLEVRAFFPVGTAVLEDPVTGSLNASVGEWLLGSGRLAAPYVARQGTAIGVTGRVHVSLDADGNVWVGGATHTLVEGTARV
jgi:PhzF family phenazine biosynthesis protein